MTIYVHKLQGDLVEVAICSCGPRGKNLKEWISNTEKLPITEVVLYHNGLLVQEEDPLKANGIYYISLRLRGGKGGFGSMLRMLGAQIEKTTNHEACRDLSGRRMRDVNNEKKLADWISKKADREREREERRQAKLEKLRSEPKHYFVDPNYDKQKSQVADSLDEAITQGIHASASVPSSSKDKRKLEEDPPPHKSKKSRLWLGVEDESSSDDSEDEKTNDLSKVNEKDVSEPSSPQQPPPERGSPSERIRHKPDQSSTNNSNQADDKYASEDAIKNNSDNLVSSGDSSEKSAELNLEEVETVSDLEAFGLDQLKRALIERGLKCGGTLQQRAERLFSVKGLAPEEIDPSLKAKPPKTKTKPL